MTQYSYQFIQIKQRINFVLTYILKRILITALIVLEITILNRQN